MSETYWMCCGSKNPVHPRCPMSESHPEWCRWGTRDDHYRYATQEDNLRRTCSKNPTLQAAFESFNDSVNRYVTQVDGPSVNGAIDSMELQMMGIKP